MSVVDPDIGRFRSLAFEDDHEPPGARKLRAPESAGVAARYAVVQRALRHHHVASCRRSRLSGEGAVREDQLVLGGKRIGPLRKFVVKHLRCVSSSSDELLHRLLAQVLLSNGARGEIDAQNRSELVH